jgi:hypothetical protein
MLFSELKPTIQKAYRIKSYDDIFTNIVMSILDYDFPDEIKKDINPKRLEALRIYTGAVAIWKLEASDIAGHEDCNLKAGQWVCSQVEFAGKTECRYGFGIAEGVNAICNLNNGIVKRFDNWVDNDKIAVIFLNSTYMPDMNIGRFSDMAAETELSIKLNVFFSRFYPILIADDRKKQKVINKIVKNMMTGGNIDTNELETIIDENSLRSIMAENGVEVKGIEKIDIGEVDKSSYIQYLCKLRDDIMRWFYSLYGMNSQGSSKMAQQTTDEVNQDSNSSMILPYDMYKQAKLGLEMCKEKFGWEADVTFSKCWAERIIQLTDEAVNVEEIEEIGDDIKDAIDEDAVKEEDLTDDAEGDKIEEDKDKEKSDESEEKKDED